MPFIYRGAEVVIPSQAEVSSAFRETYSPFSQAVQDAISKVEPWETGEDPIEEFDLPHFIGSRAVLLSNGERPLWGVNPHHKARNPGLSPFVRLDEDDPRQTTDFATLELVGTVEKPILTRVYAGDYMPPLPWMMSAANADGGLSTCFEYWNDHAFVLRPSNMPEELTVTAPDWYTRKN